DGQGPRQVRRRCGRQGAWPGNEEARRAVAKPQGYSIEGLDYGAHVILSLWGVPLRGRCAADRAARMQLLHLRPTRLSALEGGREMRAASDVEAFVDRLQMARRSERT